MCVIKRGLENGHFWGIFGVFWGYFWTFFGGPFDFSGIYKGFGQKGSKRGQKTLFLGSFLAKIIANPYYTLKKGPQKGSKMGYFGVFLDLFWESF